MIEIEKFGFSGYIVSMKIEWENVLFVLWFPVLFYREHFKKKDKK